MEYSDKRFVKITICPYRCISLGKVVYFRNIPAILLEKYMWYFEYLAAIIKVKCPKKQVILECGLQGLLFGKDYIEKKRKDLISHKKGAIKKLEKGEMLTLFRNEVNLCKIEKLRKEIVDLENGIVNFYVPVDKCINLIKSIKL